MNATLYIQHAIHDKKVKYLASSVVIASLLSACSQTTADLTLPNYSQSHDSITASYDRQRAIERGLSHWGKKYSEDNKNPEYAYHYANSLIVAGKIDLAFKTLGQALKHNPENIKLISEYGRLALKMNKITLADKVLGKTKNKKVTDWRILSARGTILAKRNRHSEAQGLFRQALKLAPNETSIMNNLALSYAFDGKPGHAEDILRQISKNDKADPKIKQNLALVLGLQGRFEEAEKIAQGTLPPKLAKKNITYLKKLVSNPIKPKPRPKASLIAKQNDGKPDSTSLKKSAKNKTIEKPVSLSPVKDKKTSKDAKPIPATIKFPEAVVKKAETPPSM